jgi:hypothetical protein
MLSAPQPEPNSVSSIQQKLLSLVSDLKTTALCNINDYHPIDLNSLNEYFEQHPLKHPYFGNIQFYHCESDGTLIPIRMVVPHRGISDFLLKFIERIAAEITIQLGQWSKWSNRGSCAS